MKKLFSLRFCAIPRRLYSFLVCSFFVIGLFAQGVPFMNPDDVVVDPTQPLPVENKLPTNCGSAGIGCPYDNEPIMFVKINIHFYLNLDGSGNFNENNDGSKPPKPYTGYQRAEDLVKEANRQLEQNSPAWNANVPTCKIPIRLVLGGVYFHRVPIKGITSNDFPWNSWYANAVSSNFEINIHIHTFMPKPPLDYNNFADKGSAGVTYYGSGTAGVFNDWEMYQNWTVPSLNSGNIVNYPLQVSAKTLLHELVHTTGLHHPFQNDECDDTPKLPKCWKYDPNNPNCDDWKKISNNLMDYNEEINWSLTPCQICTIYESFSGRGRFNQSRFVTQVGGCPPSSSFFDLPSEICLPSKIGILWLNGSACFNEKGFTLEFNEVDPNPDPSGHISNLTNYSKWSFDNEVGKINLNGLGYVFEEGKTYNVRLKTVDACGRVVESAKKIKLIRCTKAGEPEHPDYATLSVYPNPTLGEISVRYEILNEAVSLNCELISGTSGEIVKVLLKNEPKNMGEFIDAYQLTDLQAGNYYLRFYTEQLENIIPLTITTF